MLRTAALAPLLVACSPDVLLGDGAVVRIAVAWSGPELTAFRSVLDAAALPEPVEVVPLGDEIGTALTARGRSAPDIVMLPQAGQLRDLVTAGRLREVPAELWAGPDGPRYAEQWRQLCHYRDRPYGVPFKASGKSLIWYDRDGFAASGLGDPVGWTVDDWLVGVREAAGTSRRLLALGAADGWILTDLFENLLLAASPAVYRELGTGVRTWDVPAVHETFVRLGGLWGIRDGLPGGVGTALTEQFADAVRDVFEHRRALAVAAPDFAEPVVRDALWRSGRTEEAAAVVPFPSVLPGRGESADHGRRCDGADPVGGPPRGRGGGRAGGRRGVGAVDRAGRWVPRAQPAYPRPVFALVGAHRRGTDRLAGFRSVRSYRRGRRPRRIMAGTHRVPDHRR